MYENFASVGYIDFFQKTLKDFGGIGRGGKEKYVFRKNVGASLSDGAYFGCIREGEQPTGEYSDLSIVVFPSNEDSEECDRWMVSLCVGSQGYVQDYAIVSLPGCRRNFAKYLKNYKSQTFIKGDFLDTESSDGIVSLCEHDENQIPETLRKTVEKYKNVIIVATIFEPFNEVKSKDIIKRYLALYAELRHWPTNQNHRTKIQDALELKIEPSEADEESEIVALLRERKYIVLQGAPGTGKTRMAKKIVKKSPRENVFFIQFHAETSYSEFVYGIVPDLNRNELTYTDHKGKFVEAILKAKEGTPTYLIIDEINRANLSNVLGPAFYLFEPTMEDSNVEIEIYPGLKLNKLPDNLYVIATMNTADRSLAVVDFALRRRFAWYTMYPHVVSADEGMYFCKDEYSVLSNIFDRYATDEELNLKPGHAYFIIRNTDNKEERQKLIKTRLKYEIMPLIKEYLADGMLSRAKDDFIDYFRKQIDEEMFR